MTNSDRNTPSANNQVQQDEQGWDQLSENILTLALGKSERMIEEEDVDDAAFDRDARDLRLLMSSAEIAARMSRQNEKDRRPHDEQALPREHTEEELDDIFRRVTARVDELEAVERVRHGKAAAPNQPGATAPNQPGATAPNQPGATAPNQTNDVERNSQRGREKGVADQCA